jgi:hypothetical protein
MDSGQETHANQNGESGSQESATRGGVVDSNKAAMITLCTIVVCITAIVLALILS